MEIESVFPKVLFTLGGVPIRDTVVHTWVILAVLVGFAYWARHRYRVWEPRPWQLGVETIVTYVDELIVDIAGRARPELVPFLTTMITFIAIANLLGLVPMLLAPTRDVNTTLALALISLASTYLYSIRARGVGGWLKSYIEPVAFMLPLNLLGEISRVTSMSLRLFGNIVAGEIISAVMFMLVPLLSPLLMNLLGMITGVLQALVFTVLTLVFIIDATQLAEESESND
ncbi:MAG: F0F1 ATP synthase subunit A [Chloroflexi bacterium]|nr:F0F1 ATP synthase subunit A [Chloroflexota bacterium]